MKKLIIDLLKKLNIESNTLVQLGKYFIVGGICTICDFFLLYVLTQYQGIHYLMSSVISFMSATVLNYYLCVLWIFDVRVVKNKKLEFFYYILITAVGLGLNTLLIWFFTDFMSFHYMLSKGIATIVTFWWNFLARKYFLHMED